EEILHENKIKGHYVEPYAGGAGIAINLLVTGKIQNVHLNDSDFRVYAFWHSIINRNEEFCRLIAAAELTIDEWKHRRDIIERCDKRKILEVGFSTFYMNRCNRSGVLNAGVIGGLNQQGNYKMDARFNKVELIRRVGLIN